MNRRNLVKGIFGLGVVGLTGKIISDLPEGEAWVANADGSISEPETGTTAHPMPEAEDQELSEEDK